MQNITAAFWTEYKDFDPIIRFNDMSLVNGGNFRTGSKGDCNNPGEAHLEHQCGVNVDGTTLVSLLLRDQKGNATRVDRRIERFGTTPIVTYLADGTRVEYTQRQMWDILDRDYKKFSNQRFFSSGSPLESPPDNPNCGNHWHLRVNSDWRR